MSGDSDVFAANLAWLVGREGKKRAEIARQISSKTGIEISAKWLRTICKHGLKHTHKSTLPKLEAIARYFGVELENLWKPRLGVGSDEYHDMLDVLLANERNNYLKLIIRLLYRHEKDRRKVAQ